MKIDKISVDFLHSLNSNTAVDPYMIDFLFASSSESILTSLGFSKLAILFDLELLQRESPRYTAFTLHQIQLSLFSDTLKSFNAFIQYFLQDISTLQSYHTHLHHIVQQSK